MPDTLLTLLHPIATLALFGQPGWLEMVIVAGLGLLLFGRRLPEVGRSLGRGIVEFKKGLQGLEEEIDPNKQANQRLERGGDGSSDASSSSKSSHSSHSSHAHSEQRDPAESQAK